MGVEGECVGGEVKRLKSRITFTIVRMRANNAYGLYRINTNTSKIEFFFFLSSRLQTGIS